MKRLLLCAGLIVLLSASAALAGHSYRYEGLKPVDSKLKVKVGDPAPDFALPDIYGKEVRLSDYRGRNVIISFVPAAFTPVCSGQWPGYNLALEMFKEYDADLIGISADNSPSQHGWVDDMGGLGFPVLSDFWPHGATAAKYGVLRSDGMADRALFIIDKKGIIRWILVNDIGKRPDLGELMKALAEVAGKTP